MTSSPSTASSPAPAASSRPAVVERFVRGKRPDPALCEDVAFVSDGFAAVVDGATDTSGSRFDGLSGGRFAALCVADALSSLSPVASAREAVDHLTAALGAALARAECSGEPTYAPCAQLVVYSFALSEVWRVGDAHFALDGVPYLGSKLVDDVTASFRRAYTTALLATGAPVLELRRTDPGFGAMWPLVEVQEAFANRPGPYGYGVLNGTPVLDEHLEVFPVVARSVVLASDGYPDLLDDLATSEARLRELLELDPLALTHLTATNRAHHPDWDSFDDRAWIRLALPDALVPSQRCP